MLAPDRYVPIAATGGSFFDAKDLLSAFLELQRVARIIEVLSDYGTCLGLSLQHMPWKNHYDFDLRRGKVQRTQVPPPLRASTVNSPPMTLALYCMFLRPIPSVFSF